MSDTEVKDVVGLLEELTSGEKPEAAAALPPELPATPLGKVDKLERVFMLKMRGVPISAIATYIGCDTSTVYRYLQQYNQEYRERLEQEPAANLIAEALTFLADMERSCLQEAHRADFGETKVDSATGEVTRSGGAGENSKNRLQFFRAAMTARGMQLKLLMETGVIPKEPEKIYHTLRGDTDEPIDTRPERTDDEVRNTVMQLIARGRQL